MAKDWIEGEMPAKLGGPDWAFRERQERVHREAQDELDRERRASYGGDYRVFLLVKEHDPRPLKIRVMSDMNPTTQAGHLWVRLTRDALPYEGAVSVAQAFSALMGLPLDP